MHLKIQVVNFSWQHQIRSKIQLFSNIFIQDLCRHFAFIYRGQYGDRKQSGIERGRQDGKAP